MSKKEKKKEYRKAIKFVLRNNGQQAFRPKELAKIINTQSREDFLLFRKALDDLVEKGQVRRVKGNRFMYKGKQDETAEGIIHINRDGYGFVEIEGQDQDIFVKRTRINTARDGDRVRIRIEQEKIESRQTRGRFGGRNKGRQSDKGRQADKGRSRRRTAVVSEVIERNRSTVIGTVNYYNKIWFVVPDDVRFNQSVFLTNVPDGKLNPGDKVEAKLGEFDAFRQAFRATLQHVFGPSDDPNVLMEALIQFFGLPQAFPHAVEAEAKKVSVEIPEAALAGRLDLRDKDIFTIDPDDAKDFDDAIHITPLPKNRYEVGVHIADVSHYVKPGSEIDDEARDRATSIYLADRVIPMLPESLSNVVCSLRPGEDKLTFTCLMEVDLQGNLHKFSFHETVIHSKHRFTYADAQLLIDDSSATHALDKEVRLAAQIARAFTKTRFKNGSVEFDLPETRVKLDENGAPVAIVRKEIKEANRLIEEFMLLANQCAAKAVERPDKPTPDYVYRVHDKPNAERIQQLGNYLKTFGLDMKLEEGIVSSELLNSILAKAKGTPTEAVVKMASLRAMAKAVYTIENIGHYGLGFSHYTHFTSPIRRYPDLLVHRILKQTLLNKKGYKEDLVALCKHCSEMEKKAEEAERVSTRQKQVLYAVDHIGASFDGLITSVTKFGVFVELQGLWLDGLVHVKDLEGDYYEFDENRYALVGSNTGKTYRPGDTMRVTLVRATPSTREIELMMN
ncbi:MAG: ribonuclease R [Rhodothermales bacterium]